MSATSYRYQLQPYIGPSSRSQCPECGDRHRRTFARYVDTRTGEPLPEEYGRCNREEACGYHRSPYQEEADGLTYKERIYQLEKTTNDDRSTRAPRSSNATKRNTPTRTPIAAPTIPVELLQQSLGQYERNMFAQLLRAHFGAGIADDLLHTFQIGTSAYWRGASVFWLIDEESRVRGGQVVLFDEQGHTVKTIRTDGSAKRYTGWVHTALAARYNASGQPQPAWLTQYMAHAEKSPCLFGLSQLHTAPANQPIAIVEAPKTAVLCTPYFPAFTWLAVGSLSYLNPTRLAPLRGYSIVLFPDASESGRAYSEWSSRVEELRRLGFQVEVSDLLEQGATEEQKKRGIDLADLLLDQWAGYPPSWDEVPSS